MKLFIIKPNEMENFDLPELVSGNYWIKYKDSKGLRQDLVNIESENGKWKMHSNTDVSIYLGQESVSFVFLEVNKFYTLKDLHTQNVFFLYAIANYDPSLFFLKILTKNDITIGSDQTNAICYQNGFLSPQHVRLFYDGEDFFVEDLKSSYGTYINRQRVLNKTKVQIGDIIFAMGIKLIYMRDFIAVSNPNQSVRFSSSHFLPMEKIKEPLSLGEITTDLAELELYKDEEYFHHTPRLRTRIEHVDVQIDDPPQKQLPPDIPLIYTMGPTLMMGMMAVVTGFSAVNGLASGTTTIIQALPSLIMCFSMLVGSMIIPLMSKRYTKKQQIKREELRQKEYFQYLKEKEEKIVLIEKIQTQILKENYLSFSECQNIIFNKKRSLWEREVRHDDFLKLRIGLGSFPLDISIQYSKEKFSLEKDNLQQEMQRIATSYLMIRYVPIPLSFTEKYLNGFLGDEKDKYTYLKGLLLQLITFHSYSDLKLVFLLKETSHEYWEFIKGLPHCWSDDRSVRFFATNSEEMKQLSSYLENIYQTRKERSEELETSSKKRGTGSVDYKSFPPYYFIITDDYDTAQNLGIVDQLLNQYVNLGFSLTIVADKLSDLPAECNSFFYISENGSGFFENELVSERQIQFSPELDQNFDFEKCVQILSNIPISTFHSTSNLPSVLSFLEMYQVGKVEQLNVLNRWQSNDPTTSLGVPIGVYESNDLFKLDIHEKFHGPHGLIAGSTGSGKSEFIITYILSLAVNFHPDELQVVLIDYKGGGLAGAFENRETGMKLPHLAGTITNLDTIEMNRSLASIESELKRRQKEFNTARDNLGESTIDIYKYQRLYREGLVKTPIAHLLIICDEFAELKSQQPEFMNQLVSTARIGRSLGVHLILATQKPSGVVNDQIWSNSKFKVCLKVQEKSDSMEMIKRADAASLKEAGRFYLQVGYNEFFALGQSAWSGAKYIPTEKVKKKLDDSIHFVDNLGTVIKSANDFTRVEMVRDLGEQLTSVLYYLIDIAKEKNIQIPQLWLNRIPEVIFTHNLKEKYHYSSSPYDFSTVVGEVDDPANQTQHLLTLNPNEGNTILYGMTGSGKDQFLTTFIYELLISHSSDEVNLYILDFGSEIFRMFQDFPQVGDVVTIEEEDKVINLFKLLSSEIEIRKDLFVNYGGNYNEYCSQNKEKTLPLIIAVISNYEMFVELYASYEDEVIRLTRNGLKYGICFLISANASSSLRYKIAQNFNQQLVLQMTNDGDYQTILGKTWGMVPSKFPGRGLVKKNGILEFQTAYVTEKEEIAETIKAEALKQRSMTQSIAKNIPVLPEKVTLQNFIPEKIKPFHVPVGIEKEGLEISYLNMNVKPATVISCKYLSNLEATLPSILKVIRLIPDHRLVVIDTEQFLIEEEFLQGILYQENIEMVVNKMILEIKEQIEQLDPLPVTYVIIGVKKLMDQLSSDTKMNFSTVLSSLDVRNFNIRFILVDVIENFKPFEFEGWYKVLIDNTEGLWVGAGIDTQFGLKINKVTKEMREEMPEGFGYMVQRGATTLIKLVEESVGKGNEK